MLPAGSKVLQGLPHASPFFERWKMKPEKITSAKNRAFAMIFSDGRFGAPRSVDL